jgi:hypothetical protein
MSQKCYDGILEDWRRNGRKIRGVKTLRIKFTNDAHTTSITYENGVLWGDEPVKGRRRIEVIDQYYKNKEFKHSSVKGAFTGLLVEKGLDVDTAIKYSEEFRPVFEILQTRANPDECADVLAPILIELLARHGLSYKS